MKNNHNSLILTLCILIAAFWAVDSCHGGDYNGDDNGCNSTRSELHVAHDAAREYAAQKYDGLKVFIIDASGLECGVYHDTVDCQDFAPDSVCVDTIQYRFMKFRARTEDGGGGMSVVQFELFFPPDMSFWGISVEEVAARTERRDR